MIIHKTEYMFGKSLVATKLFDEAYEIENILTFKLDQFKNLGDFHTFCENNIHKTLHFKLIVTKSNYKLIIKRVEK